MHARRDSEMDAEVSAGIALSRTQRKSSDLSET